MTKTDLSETALSPEKIRFTASIFLYSVLAGHIVLLQKFFVQKNFLTAITLMVILFSAFLCGFLATRWKALRRNGWLPRIQQGFLINAAGMLFVVAASFGNNIWFSLISGVIISGLGQGIIFMTLKEQNRYEIFSVREHIHRSVLILAGMVFTAGICLITQSAFVDMTGFPYAFSLLLDLSLLGALYINISQQGG